MTREQLLELLKPIWAEQLRQRQQQHARNVRIIDERCVANRNGRSGAHVAAAFDAAVLEARERAKAAREVVLRAVQQTQTRWSADELQSIYLDVITNMNQDIGQQFEIVLQISPVQGGQFNGNMLTLANEEVAAINKEIAELALIAATPEIATTPAGGVVVHGSVFGAVQTGSGATANVTVTIDSASAAVLADAVRALRASLKAQPPPDLPAYADAIFADIEAEAVKPQPEPKKIAALLATGASVVETLANAPGAWETVRHAARAIGVPVP
jgi:hypothetical protein